jgi:hypothetical protein
VTTTGDLAVRMAGHETSFHLYWSHVSHTVARCSDATLTCIHSAVLSCVHSDDSFA